MNEFQLPLLLRTFVELFLSLFFEMGSHSVAQVVSPHSIGWP
jgi:hypothetical protein